MAIRHKRTIEAFDSEGRRYLIYEYVTLIPMGTIDDPNAVAEGLKMYSTSGGDAVNRRGDADFEIVSTGIRVQALSKRPIFD